VRPDEFRKDINGLRAWAVLAVIFYHFNLPAFGKGFLGVDVFFVISGFFMAKIVLTRLEGGRFSLFGFYLARARRIWPALLVLVAAVIALGWFMLLPVEYKQLGKHARDTLQFVSNIRYLDEAGYFDTVSREKWLLHTWSLSIEWQFYLLYPLVLLACKRLVGRWRLMLGLHGAAWLASFIFSLSLSVTDPDSSYYLLSSRAWELLSGGMVFIVYSRIMSAVTGRRLLEGAGLVLIVAALIAPDGYYSHWNTLAALAAVSGAALVILAGRGENSPWTGNRAMQWVGSRSYSIYLWHWPVTVVLFYFDLLQDILWMAAGMGVSLILGHLSFTLVELPTQKWLGARRRWLAALILLACLAVGILGSQQVRKSGFPLRLPEEIVRIEKDALPKLSEFIKCDDPLGCAYGSERVAALVVGDSHAHALIDAVVAATPADRHGVYLRAAAGCPIVFGAQLTGPANREECLKVQQELAEELNETYAGTPLILITRASLYPLGDNSADGIKSSASRPWVHFSRQFNTPTPAFLSEFEQHYVATVCRLRQKQPVYLMRPLPEFPLPVPQMMGRAAMLGREMSVRIDRDEYLRRNAFLWSVQDRAAAQCGAQILDPTPYVCDEDHCYGNFGDRALFYDTDHMSQYGASLLTPMFRQVFEAAPQGKGEERRLAQ